jgi:hypothetical protein
MIDYEVSLAYAQQITVSHQLPCPAHTLVGTPVLRPATPGTLDLGEFGLVVLTTRSPFPRWARAALLTPSARCLYCERAAEDLRALEHWELDHRLPRRLGGGSVSDNAALSCSTCNREKGARLWAPGCRVGRRCHRPAPTLLLTA